MSHGTETPSLLRIVLRIVASSSRGRRDPSEVILDIWTFRVHLVRVIVVGDIKLKRWRKRERTKNELLFNGRHDTNKSVKISSVVNANKNPPQTLHPTSKTVSLTVLVLAGIQCSAPIQQHRRMAGAAMQSLVGQCGRDKKRCLLDTVCRMNIYQNARYLLSRPPWWPLSYRTPYCSAVTYLKMRPDFVAMVGLDDLRRGRGANRPQPSVLTGPLYALRFIGTFEPVEHSTLST